MRAAPENAGGPAEPGVIKAALQRSQTRPQPICTGIDLLYMNGGIKHTANTVDT